MIGGWDTAIDRSVLFPEEKVLVSVKEEKVPAKVERKQQVQPEKKPQPKWEKVKVGDAVTHKTFGDGVVKSVDGRFLVVAFAHKESRFIYPWVFEEGYLKMLGQDNP